MQVTGLVERHEYGMSQPTIYNHVLAIIIHQELPLPFIIFLILVCSYRLYRRLKSNKRECDLKFLNNSEAGKQIKELQPPLARKNTPVFIHRIKKQDLFIQSIDGFVEDAIRCYHLYHLFQAL